MSKHKSNQGAASGNESVRAQNIRHSRVREPINRSFGMIRGKFPSKKMGRMIHWESQLERDAVALFEFSSGVTSYREQPLIIFYTFNGRTRRYTPDFEIVLFTGEIIIIEIKPLEKLRDPLEKQRFDRIQNYFSNKQCKFLIFTEEEIRQSILLQNLALIFRYQEKPLSLFERREYAEKFAGKKEISVNEAVKLLGSLGAVWLLIGERILFCNLRAPLTAHSTLSTIKREDSHEELFF